MNAIFKYYTELENKEYKVYWNYDSEYIEYNVPILFDEIILKNLAELFKELSFIDALTMGFNFELFTKTAEYAKLSSEEQMNLYEIYVSFEGDRDNLNEKIKYLSKKIDISLEESIEMFEYYETLLKDLYVMNVFPEYKKHIEEIMKEICRISALYYKKSHFHIFLQKKCYESYPYTWYFTPGGFLYNCNGKLADLTYSHNCGNMARSFAYVKKCLTQNMPILFSASKAKEKIQKIINQGYVTEFDSQLYNKGEFNINLLGGCEGRCYQKNLIQLITGFYRAEVDFYRAFLKLNASSRKQEIFNEIWESCEDDYNDMFIRFCGFSKVESCERKITTASPFGIELFLEYLKRGWNLYIIPQIVYSEELDAIRSESYFVLKYLEESLENYEEKGRVLVRGINC